jgi:dTDP-glucose 4,6-dehydratase
MRNLLVTGGAGFIGSNFVHYILERYPDYRVVVYDKLTYAGRLENFDRFNDNPRFAFVHGDICDMAAVKAAIQQHDIDTIVNFAAETHVDRSIMAPDAVITTNVNGTWVLLEAARELKLERFHQISTDEVYGAIPAPNRSKEGDSLEPRSPYSASKAGAEHLVYAYHVTYGLPATITRGSNNIGPYHYPEKALPLFITNAIDDIPLPLYGDGMQMRDYQYVTDHCEAIDIVLHQGAPGEAYNVGTGVETHNIDMARKLLDLLGKPHSLIHFVADRAGHDRRYALDTAKLQALGWRSRHTFDQALEQTVRWYLERQDWWRPIKAGEYLDYYRKQYVERA